MTNERAKTQAATIKRASQDNLKMHEARMATGATYATKSRKNMAKLFDKHNERVRAERAALIEMITGMRPTWRVDLLEEIKGNSELRAIRDRVERADEDELQFAN